MKSIGQAASLFHLSTRTLRYWESIHLLKSAKLPGSSYRAYDEQALRRIAQILVLRRLRIPLKEIGPILDANEAGPAIAAVEKAVLQSERDMLASSQLRLLQMRLLHLLRQAQPEAPVSLILADEALVRMASALPEHTPNAPHKEEALMSEPLTYPQRTVYLPPMTVACAHFFGREPENSAFAKLASFIRESNLPEQMPSLRIFGFNNPSIPNEKGEYGYEYWVTIPEDLPVPASLAKRSFGGGLYLAHCIRFGDFHEWKPFSEQVDANPDFVRVPREPDGMWGTLEEHLNAYAYFLEHKEAEGPFDFLDLLIPVERKSQ